jgi:para-nitrobenzyl esterase
LEDDMVDGPVAETRAGKVRGAMNAGICVFKGVRYGADTSSTRFAAPEPASPWTGIQDALQYGASAPQALSGDAGGLFGSWRPQPALPMSEDCLFLNVWTPGLRDGKKRPVMVWLHGGGFVTGSGSSNAYEGTRLARRGDVVVITINHRLNTFGFLYLGEYGESFADSGNAGILDIVLALRWVREHAAEFGGDADNVTIFGESGGGAKVSVLMGMDSAQGLFHRGIVQSGPWLKVTPDDVAARAAARVIDQLGLTGETIDRIRSLPAERIQAAVASATEPGGFGIATGPVLDQRNIARHPFYPDAAPQGRQIPMMIGTCRTETSLLQGVSAPELFALTWEALPKRLGPWLQGRDIETVIAQYRKLHPTYTPAAVYFTLTTDRGFYRSSVTQADRKAEQGGAPVYFYLLDWETPVQGGKWLVPHALDIGFVFDNVARSESMSGIGREQQQIADYMSEAWLAFARSGDPNHAGLPSWPKYDALTRATMIFDLTPHVVNDPRAAERDVFRASASAGISAELAPNG